MTVHVLIWGDLSHARFFGTALLSEMIAVMRQKSAAVIVPISAQGALMGEGPNINQGGVMLISTLAQSVRNGK